MVNTMKLLLKKKSFIIMGIVAPAVIIVFFSFAFGSDMNYKVGGETYNEEKYGEGAGFAAVFFGWLEKVGMFDPEG